MEEPSVLDYVKSKLAFWKRSALEQPPETQAPDALPSPDGVDEATAPANVVERLPESAYGQGARVYPAPEAQAPLAVGQQAGPAAQQTGPASRQASPAAFPWLAMAPLLLGLIAQSLLEPPERVVPLAVALYLACAAILVFAFFRRRLAPAALPAGKPGPDPLSIRWDGLLIGSVLMLATFFFFGAPEGDFHNFNLLNTPLWLLSIGYIVWALWDGRARPGPSAWSRLGSALRRPDLNVTLSRWALLVLAVAAIALFYRFYRLPSLPAEMVSDHAEKLLDVQDVLRGDYHVFFPRNTGREFFQFYWTALMVVLFNIPVSFMALKVGTVLTGLVALVYIYRLGYELGNRWVALLALAFCGVSYWANIMSRIGLRFPLYPFFTAPMLFYMLRGLRNLNRNDFIKAGLWLGLGLHGYTSYRIVPVVVGVGFLLYLLHQRDAALRKRALVGFGIVALVSLAVFMPLARFAYDDSQLFMYRSITRFGDAERPLPGPAALIFLQNTWNAVTMFFYDDGDVWVHSVTHRPALDIVSAALMFVGVVLVVARYLRRRHWLDLFLLVSIPLFLLPSIMSLAFPNENPNLNRTAAAYIPAFLLVGIGLDALFQHFRRSLPGRAGVAFAWIVGLALFGWSAWQNYDLLFNQYDASFRSLAWNATEMGQEVRAFEDLTGAERSAWVVAYPYWVDTRLVGVEAGHPDRDLGIPPERLPETGQSRDAKLFVLNKEDTGGLNTLIELYPEGRYWLRPSQTPTKEFILFLVPPAANPPVVVPGEETP